MLALTLCILICGGIGTVISHIRRGPAVPAATNYGQGALFGAVVGLSLYFVSGVGDAAAMNQSTSNVKLIGEAGFDADVIHSTKPVVMDFYATWCGPCKILSPRLDKLATSFTNRIRFVKVNIDESQDLARQFDIREIPTLIFFKNGKIVDRTVGLPGTDELKGQLKSLAGSGS